MSTLTNEEYQEVMMEHFVDTFFLEYKPHIEDILNKMQKGVS